jgi:hypothetical protein
MSIYISLQKVSHTLIALLVDSFSIICKMGV